MVKRYGWSKLGMARYSDDIGPYVLSEDYDILASRTSRLELALKTTASMLVLLGSNHESPEKRRMASELADILSKE